MGKMRFLRVRTNLITIAIEILKSKESLHPTHDQLSEWLAVIRSAVLLLDDLLSEIEELTDYENSNQPFRLNGSYLEVMSPQGQYLTIGLLNDIINATLKNADNSFIRTNQSIAALFCIMRDLQAQINQRGK